jgi:colanic acid/amylovoran biosynthesis protein
MKSKPLFILAGNGPYDNRGCEAITRGTVKILRHYFDNPSFLCISHFQSDEQFKKQCRDEFDSSIMHKKTNRALKMYSSGWFIHETLKRVSPARHQNLIYKDMLPYINDAAAVLSIGGDNYTLDYGIPRMYTYLDDVVLRKGKTLVIWGASVGPFSKNPKYEKYMIDHLRRINGIFGRESATIEYLEKKGLKENIFRVADPAFLMESIEPKQKNEVKIQEGAIGLNFSPLMAKHVTDGDLEKWTKIVADIVSRVSKATSRTIYLIPHVTTPHSNDYLFLKNVLEVTDISKDKIILIPPIYNASETKWIISKMFVFGGARTHSTIAALSSCVPTLSFAYSIKAIGINKDIFGHDNYCLAPNKITPEIVVERIVQLLENNGEIRNYLGEKIPMIKEMTMESGKYLQNLIDR